MHNGFTHRCILHTFRIAHLFFFSLRQCVNSLLLLAFVRCIWICNVKNSKYFFFLCYLHTINDDWLSLSHAQASTLNTKHTHTQTLHKLRHFYLVRCSTCSIVCAHVHKIVWCRQKSSSNRMLMRNNIFQLWQVFGRRPSHHRYPFIRLYAHRNHRKILC